MPCRILANVDNMRERLVAVVRSTGWSDPALSRCAQDSTHPPNRSDAGLENRELHVSSGHPGSAPTSETWANRPQKFRVVASPSFADSRSGAAEPGNADRKLMAPSACRHGSHGRCPSSASSCHYQQDRKKATKNTSGHYHMCDVDRFSS